MRRAPRLRAAGWTGLRALLASAVAAALCACGGRPAAEAPTPAPATGSPIPVTFTHATRPAGIRLTHNSGARGRKYLPETMGSGVVFFDADGDGRPDLFFVNAMDWPESRRGPSYQSFYRNRGDGTFEEATAKAGLRIEAYALGAAAADYDNDGHVDLYLNGLGADHLFRNRGDGTFEDVTRKAGVGDPGFGSSATWLDYDRDGWLDLFVCNYVQWSPATD